MPQEIVGPIPYVDVRDEETSSAEALLEAAGILYTYAESSLHSASIALGRVLLQDPDPDITTEVDSTDVVTLTLSLGALASGAGAGTSGAFDFSFGFGFHRFGSGPS